MICYVATPNTACIAEHMLVNYQGYPWYFCTRHLDIYLDAVDTAHVMLRVDREPRELMVDYFRRNGL